MELFRLFGSIMVTDEDAIKALDRTDKKAKETSTNFGDMAKTAGKVGLAVVGAGVTATGALIGIAKNSADAGDRVDKMSQKLGMSRKSFQEWDFIMSQAGTSVDNMRAGMKNLSLAMTQESKKTTSALSTIGLSMEDIADLSQDDAFELIIKKFQELPESAEKSAAAVDLFGRSGQELMPLMNSTSASVDELRQQAHDLGMVMSDEAVDSAASLTDAFDVIQRAGAGLMNTLGAELMPVLLEVLDVVIENIPFVMSIFQALAPILSDVFRKLLPPLLSLVESLLPPLLDLIMELLPFLAEVMEAIMPVIIDLFEMLLPPIMELVQLLLPLLLSLIKPLLPVLQPILALLQPFIDLLMMLLRPLIDLINKILPPIIGLFSELMTRILPPLQKALAWVAEVVGGVFKSVFEAIGPVIEGVKKYFTALIDFVKNVFTGNWKGAWESIIKIFSAIWDTLKSVFKLPFNWIIDGLNAFIRGLNKIKIPDWVPVVGGKGINIKEIPRLKAGIDYVPHDFYPAFLDEGERVLTKEENRERSEDEVNTYNIYLNDMPVSDADKRKLAQYIEEERRRGLQAVGAMA